MTSENDDPRWEMSTPGVKGHSVQEGPVIMVPDVVPRHRLTSAGLWNILVVDGDVIIWVINVF